MKVTPVAVPPGKALMTTQNKPQIGWIGTGIMGRSMAGHLLDAGYALFLHNRTRSKAETLLERGAVWKDSPAEVAAESDLLFLMVGYPEEMREVLIASLASLREGSVVVDMSTGSPEMAREMAGVCERRGIGFLDAPVSGGDSGARSATLSIMVGGRESLFETVRPCLERMGTTIVHHGRCGNGQNAKLVNQILIAGNMIGVCEALLYARKAGLDMEKTLRSVEKGAAGSWSLSNLAPRIAKDDFAPGFMIGHFLKDMRLALEEADRMRLALPGLALVRQLYLAAAALGYEKYGTQALIRALDAFTPKKPQGQTTT